MSEYLEENLLYSDKILNSTVSSTSDCRSRDHKFKFQLGQITFLEIDSEIISKVNFSLPLIQEWQLSVTYKSILTA